MKGLRSAVAGVLAGTLVAFAVGCQNAEIDQLRGANLKMSEQLRAANEAVAKMKQERDAAYGQIDSMNKDILVAQKDAKLWQDKYAALEGMRGTEAGVPAELEKRLREIMAKWGGTYEGGVMTFPADIVFDAGKIDVKPKAKEAIKEVARAINEMGAGFRLRINGHTDEQPIKKSGYKDNWQLGAERARAVLKILEAEKIAPERMYMTSFSMYQPVDPGQGEASWKKNRRVEIQLLEEAAPLLKEEKAAEVK